MVIQIPVFLRALQGLFITLEMSDAQFLG